MLSVNIKISICSAVGTRYPQMLQFSILSFTEFVIYSQNSLYKSINQSIVCFLWYRSAKSAVWHPKLGYSGCPWFRAIQLLLINFKWSASSTLFNKPVLNVDSVKSSVLHITQTFPSPIHEYNKTIPTKGDLHRYFTRLKDEANLQWKSEWVSVV